VQENEIGVDHNGWKTVSSVQHFKNEHLELRTDAVRTPLCPQPRPWTIAYRKTAVVIAPMTADNKIVLIEQERIPVRAAIWEMPSGQIDNAGPSAAGSGDHFANTIEQTALRELREEAGYQLTANGQLVALGHFFSSPGFTNEHCYFFLARPVEPCPDFVRDQAEAILNCRAFTLAELRRMISENQIRDANTLGICARMAAGGFLSLQPSD
jgi:ADP-ribose pyrophosphatase